MTKMSVAVALLCVLMTVDAFAQTPFYKVYPLTGRNPGFNSIEQVPGGGYIVAGNLDLFDHLSLVLFKVDANGDSLWLKTFTPAESFNSNNKWSVKSVVASDGGSLTLIQCRSHWDKTIRIRSIQLPLLRINSRRKAGWF